MAQKFFKEYHLLPLFLSLSIPLFIDAIRHSGSRYYIAISIGLFAGVLMYILLRIKPFYFVLLNFILLFLSVIYLVQVLEYHTFVNPSTWGTLLDTHSGESLEFIQGLNIKTILLIVFEIFIYLFYLFYTYGKIRKKYSRKLSLLSAALLILMLVDFSVKGASRLSFPLRELYYAAQFVNTKFIEYQYLKIKNNINFNAKRLDEFNNNEQETIIIVVGEALRRDHLEYYGYNKPTTPYLKNENLIIYSDVISAANQTINSLKRVFTLAEDLDDKLYWTYPSFIKSFKEVGFKTFWITNQNVYGRHESQASFIARETDVFMSNKPRQYDEVLLPQLKKILQDTVPKKLIFLHLMGNHAGYKYRYPKDFDFFDAKKEKDYKKSMVKYYDNAVRYNDYFLYKVLKNLKEQEGEKSFIMFSDHGESLFDSGPDICYHGSEKPAKSEVEIPLVLWFSDEFKANHPNTVQQVIKNKDLPVISYDFFHSFPALFGISFDLLNQQNNIFGKNYIPKKNRKIINVSYKLLPYDELKDASE